MRLGPRTLEAMRRFGARIRQARDMIAAPQVYVSHSLGLSDDAYISRVENGSKRFNHRKLPLLARALEIPVSELIELSLEVDRAIYYDSLEADDEHEAS